MGYVPRGISNFAPAATASLTCLRIRSDAATLTTGPVVVTVSKIKTKCKRNTIGVTESVGPQFFDKLLQEGVVDRFMNINAFDGTTALSGIKCCPIRNFNRTEFYVRIGA